MFQSWTSLISRVSSSSSSSTSTSPYFSSFSTSNPNVPPYPSSSYATSSPLLAHVLPRPPVDIIITPATPYLAQPGGNGGSFTPQQQASSTESEMRSRRRGSGGRGARVLDFDGDRVGQEMTSEVEVEVGGRDLDHGRSDEVVDLDGQEEEAGARGHWGPAVYDEIPMGYSMGSDQEYRQVDLDVDVDLDVGMDGAVVAQGGHADPRLARGTGTSWSHFPSSRTGYRRLVNPYSSTTTSSPSSPAPTSRIKLNLLLFFFALVLASLGMISLMLPSLGGVEFGVRVEAHGHGRGRPTMVGVEEGLDGLRLGHGHEADDLKKRSQGGNRPAGVVHLPVPVGTGTYHDEEDALPINPVVSDERTVTAHQASMKQSRERLERRLRKVGRRGLGGHVKRQKKRSWGIWAA